MSVLITPIITEKSMQDANNSWYTFSVAKDANKSEIGKEVAKHFGVKVLAVKTMIVKGKTRRAGKMRKTILTSSGKKALVQIAKGQKIDLFDTTENAQKT